MRIGPAFSQIATAFSMFRPRSYGSSHSDRLETFYSEQSSGYDVFRDRLLQGRNELVQSLHIPEGGKLLDLGAGTGRNLEWIAPRLGSLEKVVLVDLSPSLLSVARDRILAHGWQNVEVCLNDATTYKPPEGEHEGFDAIILSYSLSMMPNWFDAIDRAHALLKPEGQLGVVDFYVSDKWPSEGFVKHSAFMRFFWPAWFSYTNVLINSDHLTYLHRRFERVALAERMTKVPFLLGLEAPYYIFVGRKKVS